MRKTIWALIALSMLVISNLPSAAADKVDEIRKRGVLIVGVRDDLPPFGFINRDTGETVGIDVDLAAAVAKRLDVKLRVRSVTPQGWIPDLLGGNVDLVAAAVSSNPDRDKLVDFSAPYFKSTQRVLARKGAVTSVKSLEGKKVGVGQGSPAEREIKAQAPGAACYFFTDARKAVEALRKGEVDALSASGSNLYGCLSALPKDEFEITESVKLAEEGYRLALRKGSPKLLEAVNATLADLDANGGSRAILDKWFQGKGIESKIAAVSRSVQSVGVVTRVTSTEGRFLVLPITGIFRPSAEVTILDPAGNPIGSGTVASTYQEESYVDAPDVEKGLIQPGYVVAMNMSADEAKKALNDNRDTIDRIRADEKASEDRIAAEKGAEFERAKKERERHQEEMAKTKMMLDYQYSDPFYGYYGYPFR
jgi:polar amino acid transport system substrate-binding protein